MEKTTFLCNRRSKRKEISIFVQIWTRKYVYLWNLTCTWSETIRPCQNIHRNARVVKFKISRIPIDNDLSFRNMLEQNSWRFWSRGVVHEFSKMAVSLKWILDYNVRPLDLYNHLDLWRSLILCFEDSKYNEYISSILASDSVKKYHDGGTWYHWESFNVLCPDGYTDQGYYIII
jgi:hypothetical protein